MILIDIPMPDRCGECKLMRCSKCIPMDSRNILDYQASKTKPKWCPLKEEKKNG